jgi:type I restriction enzyme S subunit
LSELQVTIPSKEAQQEFVAFVKQTDKSKFEIQKSLEKLETLKKALMQKYFG